MGATFYIEFPALLLPNVFCHLQLFITIKAFFIPPLLEENRICCTLHVLAEFGE